MPTHPWYTTGVPAASLIGANVRQIAAGPPSQGDRQGRPYYTTNRPATPVYSRGGACPRPVGLPPPWGGAGQPLMKRFRSR